MTEAELKSEFGEKGWKQLPHTVVKRHHFTQARITVDEHHIGVYADKEDGHMKRAPHPKGLLPSSPVTPSLAAAVMNGNMSMQYLYIGLKKSLRGMDLP